MKYAESMGIQLAPDVEAALVSEAAARGMSVDGLLREAWQLYRQRHETPVSPVRRVPYESREQEMAWTREPDRRYLGQWVALQGSRVVASGIDGKVVYKTAREQGVQIPFMFFVAEPDPRPFVGGWLGTE